MLFQHPGVIFLHVTAHPPPTPLEQVFINICKHEALAEPALKKKLDASGEEVEGMNIPLSVGPRRFDKDKSSVQCHVYDVIVNPTVIADVVEDITGKKRDFLCQLALQGLEQKYKEQLDKRYKLPKLKYLGEKIATQLHTRSQESARD